MGNEMSLQLRQENLMTKIMLKNEEQIIEHIQEQKIEINRPINQMGDTILHYASYKSLKKLIEYLLEHMADPLIKNNRNLSSVDVAIPQIRQWLVKKYEAVSYKEESKKQTVIESKIIRHLKLDEESSSKNNPRINI